MTKRLFIAIEPTAAIVSELDDHVAAYRDDPDVRCFRPGQLHLTLRFLGDVDAAQSRVVENALAAAAERIPAADVSLAGWGAFPNTRTPRVLYRAVHDPHRVLTRLADALSLSLATIGAPPDPRPFTPHLTVARARGDHGRRRRSEILQDMPEAATTPFAVRELILFESRLTADGAVYTPLQRAALPTSPPTDVSGGSSPR